MFVRGAASQHLFALFHSYTPDPDQYLAAAVDKHNLLQRAPSPRLACAGGSATAFGLDGPEFLGRVSPDSSIWDCTRAWCADFILNEVEASPLQAGDVVLVSLEYELMASDGTEPWILYLLESRPDSAVYLDSHIGARLLDQGLIYLGSVARNAGRAWLHKDTRPRVPYVRSGFDAYGDLVIQRDMKNTNFSVVRLPTPSPGHLQRLIDRLNAFCQSAAERGVRVCWAYPPVAASYFDSNRTSIERIQARLRRACCCRAWIRPSKPDTRTLIFWTRSTT